MSEKRKGIAAAISLLITFAVAIAAVFVELLKSLSLSMTSGVALNADSFDQRFVAIMIGGLAVIFVIVYFLICAKTNSKERR